MSNSDIAIGRQFHDGTKHPNGHLLDPYHRYDPTRRPRLFKDYRGGERIRLSLEPTPQGVSALQALLEPAGSGGDLDLGVLANILHFSAGITKWLRYRWTGERIAFRAAACTGALYHIELYLASGPLEGLEAGLYHYDPESQQLVRLRRGDPRPALLEACAQEPSLAGAPAALIITDVFWRNAVKYQARAYRHSFWDAGTLLANTLALATAHDQDSNIILGFIDAELSKLLGLEGSPELPLAVVPLGSGAQAPETNDGPGTLEVEERPIEGYPLEYPVITQMHAASTLASEAEVRDWRTGRAADRREVEPRGKAITMPDPDPAELPADPLESVIRRRGSTRVFAHRPLRSDQLAVALEAAAAPIGTDAIEAPAGQLYLIVNAVEGLKPGSYRYHPDSRTLEPLAHGDFRGEAGYLALSQALGADASVNLYFLADLSAGLKRFGNRGYRLAQLEAAVRAGRVYLAAYCQRFGATGLTFSDDAVIDFFSPLAAGLDVMFLIALGHRKE